MRVVVHIGRRAGWVLVPALLLTGCFAKVQELPALAQTPTFAPAPGDQPRSPRGAGHLGGGGSRAATFAAGVLEALARIRGEGRER